MTVKRLANYFSSEESHHFLESLKLFRNPRPDKIQYGEFCELYVLSGMSLI